MEQRWMTVHLMWCHWMCQGKKYELCLVHIEMITVKIAILRGPVIFQLIYIQQQNCLMKLI